MIDPDTIAFHQWLSSVPMMDDFERNAARKAWQAATARERERCRGIAFDYGQFVPPSIDDASGPEGFRQGVEETVLGIAERIGVADEGEQSNHIPDVGKIEHKPDLPADLLERAHEFLQRPRDHKKYGPVETVAAFAAEYAAGQIATALTNRHDSYLAALADRDAAEKALEEQRIAYSRAMESRQHWRESAEIAEKDRPDLIKATRTEEREACAKVADMEAIQAIGWNPVFVAHRIAAAIRAQKGGGNGV